MRYRQRYVKSFAPPRSFLKEHLKGIDEHGSFALWCRHVEFKKSRNQRECLMLSRCLDALLSGQWALAGDLIARRLAGVHQADAKDNWAIASAIERTSHDDSFVSTDALHKFLKVAERYNKLSKGSPIDSDDQNQRGRGSSNRQRNTKHSLGNARPAHSSSTVHFSQPQQMARHHQQMPFPARNNGIRTGSSAGAIT